jgi:intracellular septation protein A
MSSIVVGIIPIVVFVILDSFTSLRTAIVSALVCGLLEVVASFYFTGGIDWITIVVFVLLVIMGVISIKMKSPMAFKLQPAATSFLFTSVLLISYLIGKPLLAMLISKYHAAFAEMPVFVTLQSQIGTDGIFKLFAALTLSTGLAFLVHTLLMIWAALRLSKWWWLALKAVGPYALMFGFALIHLILFNPLSLRN